MIGLVSRRSLAGSAIAAASIAALRSTPPARAVPVPDAAIIAAAAEYRALHLRFGELASINDFELPPHEHAAWEAEEIANLGRQKEIRTFLAQATARTLDGIKAKAEVAMLWIGDNEPDDPASLTLSVMQNLAAGGVL